MIKSQLIAGLYNASHQSRILSEVQNLTTLEQLKYRLLTLESTAKASTHLRPSSDVTHLAPIKSDYQKRKQVIAPSRSRIKDIVQGPSTEPHSSCPGCGHRRHVQGRRHCPARGQKCLSNVANVAFMKSMYLMYLMQTNSHSYPQSPALHLYDCMMACHMEPGIVENSQRLHRSHPQEYLLAYL